MTDPKTFQFNLSTDTRPPLTVLPMEWFPRVQDYWPACTTKRDDSSINAIKAIVIHATAGATSAGAITRMKEANVNDRASFHWLVPDEDESQHGRFIWACVPEELAAWHVQNTAKHPDVNNDQDRINRWSLGIEIVNSQSRGDAFSDWQIKITAQIVRYCWAKYPQLKYVVSHAKLDPERRSDPGVNFPWESFKNLVLAPQNSIHFLASKSFDFSPDEDHDNLHSTK